MPLYGYIKSVFKILTTDPIKGRWIVTSIDIILAALVLVGLLVRDVGKSIHSAASLKGRATSGRRNLASVDSVKFTANNVVFRRPLVLKHLVND